MYIADTYILYIGISSLMIITKLKVRYVYNMTNIKYICVYIQDKSVIVSSPTGSGNTVIFELAIINAVKNILGNHIAINWYFYHLCQSTHKKLQKLSLETIYKEDSD